MFLFVCGVLPLLLQNSSFYNIMRKNAYLYWYKLFVKKKLCNYNELPSLSLSVLSFLMITSAELLLHVSRWRQQKKVFLKTQRRQCGKVNPWSMDRRHSCCSDL